MTALAITPGFLCSEAVLDTFGVTARVTSAVLDRLLHHAETVTLEGNSFRMKDVIDK